MEHEFMKLEKIFNIDMWQNIQDLLAAATNLAIITVDYKGTPITKHSGCSKFCESMRSYSDLNSNCQKCDSRGGIDAARSNAPYIYLCHCNLIDLAIPIIVDNKYIGAIMAGQVRLPESDNHKPLEKIIPSADNYQSVQKNETLNNYYDLIPYLEFTKIQQIADLLFGICNYMITEALNKHLLSEAYKAVIFPETHHLSNLNDYSISTISTVKNILGHEVTNRYIKTPDLDTSYKSILLLQPAIDYINLHQDEFVSLSKASDICHISTSYFSRIFLKTIGIGYTRYISQIKIEWAKQLLVNTDFTISTISTELGYTSSSYFIMTFKKHEKLTPTVYRKYYKE